MNRVLPLLALLGCAPAPLDPLVPAPVVLAAPAAPKAAAKAKPEAKGGDQPTVVFIVLDTVRAASMGICDYERPTTPFLEELTSRPNVSHTCHAYSPATWTVPSHASYFTGTMVPVHESDSMGHTWEQDVPTLSEIMHNKGYQSVMISANPTLSVESGLQRGFDVVDVAKGLEGMRGEDVSRRIKRALDEEVDPNKPLFLFVNVLDAHDPYPAIPRGVDWAPAQDEVAFDIFHREQDAEYHRYIRGEMPAERARQYLKAIRNGYDYGISMADRTTGQIMNLLRREGWLEDGFRFVLTSDHGEFLGEHGLLRHGCYVWEPVVRVPFIYFDSARDKPLPLPEPFSALHAFWLVSEGKLPNPLVPANSFSKRRDMDVKVCADMAAVWRSNTDKLVWLYGSFYHFDLATDPGEMGRVPMPVNHPMRRLMEQLAQDHADHLVRIRAKTKDPARIKQLEALGYVE